MSLMAIFYYFFLLWVIGSALLLMAGCSLPADMPVCESNCTISKAWGVV